MLRFQLRIILSCLGGVICALLTFPYVMPLVKMGNVVIAGALGALLFVFVATLAGFIWRRLIMTAPIRWALAAPLIIPSVIYAGLQLSGASESAEPRLAANASLIAAFCAMFACAIFLAWAVIVPVERHWANRAGVSNVGISRKRVG